MSLSVRVRRAGSLIVAAAVIVGGALLASGGGAESAPVGPAAVLSHFRCYQAKAENKLVPPFVRLQDQFGDSESDVTKLALICNPVTKNHAGNIFQPNADEVTANAHLVCYATKDRIGTYNIPGVTITNQFEENNLRAKKPTLLCVPSTKTVNP